jgi:hypothetical protein
MPQKYVNAGFATSLSCLDKLVRFVGCIFRRLFLLSLASSVIRLLSIENFQKRKLGKQVNVPKMSTRAFWPFYVCSGFHLNFLNRTF